MDMFMVHFTEVYVSFRNMKIWIEYNYAFVSITQFALKMSDATAAAFFLCENW